MAGNLRLLFAFFVAFSHFGSLAHGNEIAHVTIGGVDIAIPPPPGFFRIDGKGGKNDQLLKAMESPDNRLLAVFGSERVLAEVLSERIPQGARTFNAQSVRKVEQENIPREAIPMLAARFKELAETGKFKAYINEAAGTASSKLVTQLKTDAEFKVGDSVYLGVFDQTPDSFATSSLMKVHMKGVEGVSNQPAVGISAMVMLRVRNRLLSLYGNAPYRNENDIDSMRRSILQWRDVVADANASPRR